MIKLLPPKDSQQSLRLKRLLIATATYMMTIGLMFYSQSMGYFQMSVSGLIGFSVVILGLNMMLYLIICNGMNESLGDPSLTFFQMFLAICINSVVVYYTNDIRGITLSFYLVIFVFGLFHFRVRQFLFMTLLTLLSYSVVILLLTQFRPESIRLRQELIQLLIMATVLPWFSLVGGYISQLRRQLSKANESLFSALNTIEELAIRDELTQVYNRRKMIEVLHHEKALADRNETHFSVCLFDLDHFKAINDTYGHLTGDSVLQHLAQSIHNELRTSDAIARYGGEEFLVILPQTDLVGAMKHALRLKTCAEDLVYPGLPPSTHITISIGVTTYQPVESIDALIGRVDKILYVAKSNGRNRIECSPLVPSRKVNSQ